MKKVFLALSMIVTFTATFGADEAGVAANPPKALSADESAVAAKANAFVSAFNKADPKAIASQFSEDAEWIDVAGHVVSGREAIEKDMAKMLAEHKGRKLDIDVESVRPVTPDVIVEKGTSTIEEPDGSTTVSSYSATRLKKDSDWLISQLTETGAPLAGNSEHHLQELSWLIGTWDDNSPNAEVHIEAKWTTNHAFITRSFTAKLEGANELDGTEVVGWDPVAGKFRSWVFDSDGGFSENYWTHQGRHWLIQCKATLVDGRQSTAEHTLTFISKDKHTWASANRQIDGELMPNIEPIEIVRSK
jgi:uncharacterized protein (TIGR02246 family)